MTAPGEPITTDVLGPLYHAMAEWTSPGSRPFIARALLHQHQNFQCEAIEHRAPLSFHAIDNSVENHMYANPWYLPYLVGK